GLPRRGSAPEPRGRETPPPPTAARRYTASVSYAGAGRWRPQVMAAWGRNVRSADLPTSCPLAATAASAAARSLPRPPSPPSRTSDALLAEATVRAGPRHAVFMRAERVEKD